MAVYKCKICGGDLEIQEGMGICECMYCGTKQTLPKINDERRANLYDRANHFRRNNEFDKAMSMYEQILEEDKEDAEAYWSLVLCTYGIEYVEDPVSHKRMPTVNRTQYTSVFADENYKAALRYADGNQRQIYEEEAKQIDEIQKGILDISNQEEPYDVFICYKETDQSGKRTPDSVLANDLYHQLTQEGFKVFFARITLEDKLGSAYEPYIFAALNSAKVMVVIGTKAEYFNAVWVKNEWSRYLSLIKNGAKKVLIPAYKDMDPYDMPQEFSHLQSQDMSKLGFMQDLLRGIKKLTGMDKAVQPNTGNAGASKDDGAAALLKRAFLFLEDGDFARADEFCENVLNIDPENGEAYLGKLMSALRVGKREELAQSEKRLDQMDEFSKIMRFGSEALKAEVGGYNQKVIERQEQEAERQRQLQEQEAERQRQLKAEQDEQKYQNAVAKIQQAKKSAELRSALNQLKELSAYKDAAAHIQAAETKLEKIVKAERKKQRKLTAVIAAAVLIVVVLGIAVKNIREEANRRDIRARAVELIQNGEYEEAYNTLGEITADTAECNAVWTEEMLNVVLNYVEDEQYETALEVFEYAESRMTPEKQEEVKDSLYTAAKQYVESGDWKKVDQVLVLMIDRGFMSSEASDEGREEVKNSLYAAAEQYIRNGKIEEADQVLVLLIDRGFMNSGASDEGREKIEDSLYAAAERCIENGETEEAEQVLGVISERGFEVEERFTVNIYNLAKVYFGEKEYAKSYDLLSSLNGYADSEDMMVKASLLMQLTTANVGDVVTFGRYARYEAGVEHEVEEIEWYVMDIRENEYLLVSKYPLGDIREDYPDGDINDKNTYSWEISNTRNWMNTTFYQEAFSTEEKKYILSKTLTNDSLVIERTDNIDDAKWSVIDTGNNTIDNVFALSLSEILEICQAQNSGDALGKKINSYYHGETYEYLVRMNFPNTVPSIFNARSDDCLASYLRTLRMNGCRMLEVSSSFFGDVGLSDGVLVYWETTTGTSLPPDFDRYSFYVTPAIWVSIDAATE